MTTTTDSFVAYGPSDIGFYANGQLPRPSGGSKAPFKLGVLAVGHQWGVYGAIDDIAIPPRGTPYDEAGVVGTSNNKHGVFGVSWTRCGVMGQWGDKPALLQFSTAPNTAAVMGHSRDEDGVVGVSDHADGVSGHSYWSSGVTGESVNGFAVDAFTALGPAAIRAQANGSGVGVSAAADSAGVIGMNRPAGPTVPNLTTIAGENVAGVVGSSAQQPGIIGTSQFVGVYGYCGAPGPMMNAGNGVEGHSANGTGVLGVAGAPGPVPTVVGSIAGVVDSSDQHTGIIGTSSNGVGVVGYSQTQIGVYGETGAAGTGSYAGYFKGNLYVSGRIDAGVKDAIVPFPDGTHRLLHCMESPEHWFEDFGAAKLKRGRAVVKLDANFAKVIKRSDYKVFVKPEGDCRGLYVRKSAASFEVRELGGGMSNVAFSYRIIGRRKDIRGHQRFAKINVTPPVFSGRRRPPRGKLLARSRKEADATPSRRRGRGRGKRA
jgi:hypothetical protein